MHFNLSRNQLNIVDDAKIGFRKLQCPQMENRESRVDGKCWSLLASHSHRHPDGSQDPFCATADGER
jgi:hypothetical protein